MVKMVNPLTLFIKVKSMRSRIAVSGWKENTWACMMQVKT